MFDIYKEELEYGGKKLILETGRIARQATSAVLVTYGETQVLCTVVAAKEAVENQDFFPYLYIIKKRLQQQVKYPEVFLKEKEGQMKKRY